MAGPWSWIEKLGGLILFGDSDDEDFVLESFLAKSKIRHVDYWRVVSSPVVDLGVHVDEMDIDRHVITVSQMSLLRLFSWRENPVDTPEVGNFQHIR